MLMHTGALARATPVHGHALTLSGPRAGSEALGLELVRIPACSSSNVESLTRGRLPAAIQRTPDGLPPIRLGMRPAA